MTGPVAISLSLVAALQAPSAGSPSRAAEVTFEGVQNLVFIAVTIDDSGPLWLTLDTGASRMLLDRHAARALGLRSVGRDSVQGAGAGRVAIEHLGTLRVHVRGLPERLFLTPNRFF